MFTVKKLLECGAQFGHQTSKWDPKMAPFIHTSRQGIHILDVQKTIKVGNHLYAEIAKTAQNGEIIFIGTKKQAAESIKNAAIKSNQPYVDARWLGGTLTNFQTIKERIKKLDALDALFETNEIEKYPKKEILEMQKTREKLNRFLGGVRHMEKLPAAIFVVDAQKDAIAIKEARTVGIKVFGICDTNCNPELFDAFIPANDDAIKSVAMISDMMADAVIAGVNGQIFDEEELNAASEKQNQIDKEEYEKNKAQNMRKRNEDAKND